MSDSWIFTHKYQNTQKASELNTHTKKKKKKKKKKEMNSASGSHGLKKRLTYILFPAGIFIVFLSLVALSQIIIMEESLVAVPIKPPAFMHAAVDGWFAMLHQVYGCKE